MGKLKSKHLNLYMNNWFFNIAILIEIDIAILIAHRQDILPQNIHL